MSRPCPPWVKPRRMDYRSPLQTYDQPGPSSSHTSQQMNYRSPLQNHYDQPGPSSSHNSQQIYYRSPLQNHYDQPGPSSSYSQRYSPYARPPHPSQSRNGIGYQDGYTRTPFSEYGALSSSIANAWVPQTQYLPQSGNHLEQNDPSTDQPKYSDRYKSVTYPEELTKLFDALDCRLCGVEATTPIVAKMHYGGKQHKKKVKQYLLEWCEKTGMPMPDMELAAVSTNKSALPTYCEICDVRLISDSDKLQHFSGRTHQKNMKDPTKKRKKAALEVFDPTNRFGIGVGFSNANATTDSSADETTETGKEGNPDDFVCQLCNVRTVSKEQLEIHLTGKKHKHKEEKQDSPPNPYRRFKCDLCQVALTSKELFEIHLKGKKHHKNLSKKDMYGMESCETCNLSFTSYDHYATHMAGKKHEKKSNEANKKRVKSNNKTEKCSLVCKYCTFVGNVDEHCCSGSLAKLTPEDLKDKFVCKPCYNMPFDNEAEYKNHLTTRRHLLSTLNADTGDEIILEYINYYCKVCKKQFRDHISHSRHLMGETHMALSSIQPKDLETTTDLFHCSVCKIMIDGEGYEEHMRNKKHLKQALINDTMNTIQKLSHQSIATTNFLCNNCNITLYSFVEYTGHVLGEEHLDRMIREKLEGYQ